MDALLELSSRGNYTVFQNQNKYFHMLSICGNSTRSVTPERDSDKENLPQSFSKNDESKVQLYPRNAHHLGNDLGLSLVPLSAYLYAQSEDPYS